MSAPHVCQSCDVSRSLVPDSRLAYAECCLRQTALRDAKEEALERTLPNLVEDFLLQDRVAVHSQDVVDAAKSQTFS